MDIKKFAVLLTVVDAGSFSKAAEKLGYTQAGVSYIMNSLEEEIGLRLLARNYNGVRLNDDGKALIGEIRQLVDGDQRLSGMIQARKERRMEKLHIASVDTIASKWLPKATAAFEKAYPDVHIDMVTGDPFEINEWIGMGTVDIGLTEYLWASNDYQWITLAKDPFYAILPASSSQEGECSITSFEGEKIFIPDFGRDRNVPALLRKNHVNVEYLYDKASAASVMKSVAMGRGMSILPALTIDLCAMDKSDRESFPKILPLKPFSYRELGASLKEEKRDEWLISAFLRCLKGTAGNDCQHGYYQLKR